MNRLTSIALFLAGGHGISLADAQPAPPTTDFSLTNQNSRAEPAEVPSEARVEGLGSDISVAQVASNADVASPTVIPLTDITSSFFVDSFYMADWNNPSDPAAASALPHRAFDFTNGFALAFAGANFGYQAKNVGVTLDFRFGEGANRLIGDQDNPVFSVLKQAYVSWSPVDAVTVDAGQFDTIYGSEVADSWKNLNYTRGALYYLMQPFYHTGVRSAFTLSDSSTATFMVVNGTNNQLDNNQTPHLGAQYAFAPNDDASVLAGYYTGAGSSGFGGMAPTSDNSWEHFFDLVVNVKTGPVTWIGNADHYRSGDEGNPSYWGVSLAAATQVAAQWGLAGRLEYLSDPDMFISGGYRDLVTATGTVDYRPSDSIVFRLDNRLERADTDVFEKRDGMASTWFATTLGVAVKTE